ncbi:uncharacterized protein LOC103698013 isoform X1 [Phoenix dactylifera]|uniref:Uncharacterized protein LOC103698013 isoform X1 n=1 Tax=Phoenix dactylifera TaxID=42345 RepID=A0A8B7BJ54_PHODC|nr:uncharacterized protein LOC103698013 isoform X1 [Phoenix dactylifera]
MVGGRVDRPEDLIVSKPAEEPWAAKDDISGGNSERKVLLGFVEDSKDQITADNKIPLSPQWLYAKPSESKPDLSAASGDVGSPSSLPHGTPDSIQKDIWRLDGSLEKKEWRRNVLDVENSRHWHEEEREAGPLSRRERRKEGDRENEYRKNGRRSDNVSMREITDSRSSDRWHDVSSHNLRHESRRDSKWSSRWGPEDKEKDAWTDKKLDVDKEDAPKEKQSFAASNRLASEPEFCDKWRSRHRQEVISSRSSVYRAAPGFGLERGRGDGTNVGFALGRGRSNAIGNLAVSRPPSTSLIGAAVLGKCGLSAEEFRYPRGKLLDIYRKHKIISSFDITPDGFEEVPPIVHSSSIEPLAFVSPDMDEEAILEDIWKGKVTSSEVFNNPCRDRMKRVNDNATACPDAGDVSMAKKECMLSKISAEEVSDTYSAGYGASHRKVEDLLNDGASILGECKAKVDALTDGASIDGMTPTVPKDDAHNAVGVPGSNHVGFELEVAEIDVLNADNNWDNYAYLKNATEDMNSTASFDVTAKLPDDSNSLFEMSFISEFSNTNGPCQISYGEAKISEQVVPPEELNLIYKDPQGQMQGPFSGADIIRWFDEGFYGTDLPVCLSDAPEGTHFQQLGEVMPHLKYRCRSITAVEPIDPSEASASTSATDFAGSVSINDQRLTQSEFENRQIQPSISKCEDLVDSNYGSLPHALSETSGGIMRAEAQKLNELAVQDAEEVLGIGRAVSSIENPLDKIANKLDLLNTPYGNHFLATKTGEVELTNHNFPKSNDLNPLGLSFSMLEGTYPKPSLSLDISNTGNQSCQSSSSVVGDASFSSRKQEPFSLTSNSLVVRDSWSNNHRINASGIVSPDDSHYLSPLETDSNQLSLEEQLLCQQLQKQQLQQQHSLFPHQTMHLNGHFFEQSEGSVRHQRSISQSLPELQHRIKCQFEQQRHFEQLQQPQQELQHRQMQLLQQHQQQQQRQLEQQLLLEQLQHQQFCETGFGTSHADPLWQNNVLDEFLVRQRLLHELQEHSQHGLQQHDSSLEQLNQAGHNLHHGHHNGLLDVPSHATRRQMLALEKQLLDLQQEQLLARQFSMLSGQLPGIEEGRHLGEAWSVDESGRFIRTACCPPQTQTAGLGQLDLLQIHQRPSYYEQPSHPEHDLVLHERMQRGIYDSNSHPFERSIPLSAVNPGSNGDLVNIMAQLQQQEVQQLQGQMYSSGQIGQLHTGVHPLRRQIANQFSASHLDATEGCRSESNAQLQNILIESQFSRLHLEAEQQKKDMNANFSFKDASAWSLLAREDENLRHSLASMLHQSQTRQCPQSVGMVDDPPTFPNEIKEPSWLLSRSAMDNSYNFPADNVGMEDFYPEGTHLSHVGKNLKDQMVNAGMKDHVNGTNISGKLAFPLSHETLDELELQDMDLLEKILRANSLDGNETVDLAKQCGSDSAIKMMSQSVLDIDTLESRIDRAGNSVVDHGELKLTASIRNSSFGSTGGSMETYNYQLGVDNAYNESVANDRMSTIHLKGADGSSLNHVYGSHIVSSQGVLSDLASALPPRRKSPAILASSEGGRGEPGGSAKVMEARASDKRDMRFLRTSSCGNAEVPEASFVDVLKKPASSEAVAASGAPGSADAGPGRSGKKKGKKGRHIDPSLLGFKVHSNRIMMGEIQRLGD